MRITVWSNSLPILNVFDVEFDLTDDYLIIRAPKEKRVYYVSKSEIQSFILETDDED